MSFFSLKTLARSIGSVVGVLLLSLVLIQTQVGASSSYLTSSISNRAVQWKGQSFEYDHTARQWRNSTIGEDNWRDWELRECSPTINRGVLTHGCNKALDEANGRQVYALRVQYYIPWVNPESNPAPINGQPTNGVVYMQIFYSYFDEEINTFVPWFGYNTGSDPNVLSGERVQFNSVPLTYIARYY